MNLYKFLIIIHTFMANVVQVLYQLLFLYNITSTYMLHIFL